MDDKNLLVEVQLLESKTYHALSNLSKVIWNFHPTLDDFAIIPLYLFIF
jgi:hypothetical protein